MKDKMMPEQEPYTGPERQRLQRMIDDACQAEEQFELDELEAHVDPFGDRVDQEYMELKDGDKAELARQRRKITPPSSE